MEKEILHRGRFLNLVSSNGWEYAERPKINGIVVILAITDDDRVVLTEQFRPPLQKQIIELPAGLSGDIAGSEHEALELAARRELLEETGYEATRMVACMNWPTSAGVTSEVVTLFRASGLKRKTEGGGDGSESIIVHEVPRKELLDWLEKRDADGRMIDPKIYAALYLEENRSA